MLSKCKLHQIKPKNCQLFALVVLFSKKIVAILLNLFLQSKKKKLQQQQQRMNEGGEREKEKKKKVLIGDHFRNNLFPASKRKIDCHLYGGSSSKNFCSKT